MAARDISGVRIPDSRMAREATRLIRDTESDLLFYHSTRVYFWGALLGKTGIRRYCSQGWVVGIASLSTTVECVAVDGHEGRIEQQADYEVRVSAARLLRYWAGGRPNSRLNARLKAASDS